MDNNGRSKGQMTIYLAWPMILLIPVVLGNLTAAIIHPAAGAVLLPFTLICTVFALWLFFTRRKSVMQALTGCASAFVGAQQQLLSDIELPCAIADSDGKLFWMNHAFSDILAEAGIKRKSLMSVFPDITRQELLVKGEPAELHVTLNDRRYRVKLRRFTLKEEGDEKQSLLGGPQEFLAVTAFDETEILECRQDIYDEKPVLGLVYLDNYDEMMDSVEEVRRSLLTALIDRRINKYFDSYEGIVRKLENDRYFCIVNRKNADQIMETRFTLLEDVKSVSVGNEMSVTLSIGMGMDGGSYSNNYEFAREAMDMALGRGGDQAVVKAGSRIEYFGGKSQQQEKSTRVKARVKAQALQELMETRDRVVIMGHRIGDIDCFGASVGMFRIAVALGKKANIVMNDITSSVQPMVDRFRDNPDYPSDMILSGTQAADLFDANTMLIVVDANRPSLTDAPELLNLAKTIVVLDHHRQGSDVIANAVLSYVEPYASSACEMVAEVMQYIADGVKIRPAEADAMYAGIVIDTNNFLVQAGVRTFEAAAFLRRSGADVTRVRKMFRDSLQENQARAEVVATAELYRDCFAIGELPSAGLDSPTVVCAQAANELLNIKGIKASVVMTLYHNVIYLSARSIDEVNVQVMMEMLGGGGHRTMAGAQLKDMTMAEARGKVKEVIEQMLEKGEI